MWSFGDTAWFRDTQLPARFLMLDAKMAVPIVALALHFRLWTVVLVLTLVAGSIWVEWRGLRLDNAVRRVRARLAGAWRPARWRTRHRVATGWAWEADLDPALFVEAAAAASGRPSGERTAEVEAGSSKSGAEPVLLVGRIRRWRQGERKEGG